MLKKLAKTGLIIASITFFFTCSTDASTLRSRRTIKRVEDSNHEDFNTTYYRLAFAMEDDDLERFLQAARGVDLSDERIRDSRWKMSLLDLACMKHFNRVATFLRKKKIISAKRPTERSSVSSIDILCHNIEVLGGFYKPQSQLLPFASFTKKNANDVDEYGQTQLHLAVYKNHQKSMRTLLSLGADPNLCDCWGNSPLHVALLANKFVAAALLLACKKTNVLLKNGEQLAPFFLAKHYGMSRAAEAIWAIIIANSGVAQARTFESIFYGSKKILSIPPCILAEINQEA